MKSTFYAATAAFLTLFTTNAVAQQGFGTNQPDKSAAVDIVSSKRGLLIPRVALTALDQAAPVKAPANSLMVYNTTANTSVTPGFYYWETNRWVRFVSSNVEKNVTVTAGENVNVVTKTSDDKLETDYKVSVKGGDNAGMVLVTKVTKDEDENDVHGTEWVKPEDFVADVLKDGNGVTIVKGENGAPSTVKLGGALEDANTEIETNGADNTLAITGLETVEDDDFSAADQKIMIMGADGILKNVSAAAISGSIGQTLTTDGKIFIKDGGADGKSLDKAVLKATHLSIAEGSITSTEIANHTIKAEDLAAPGQPEGSTDGKGTAGQVLVTNDDGTVTWVDQKTLGNKDSYVGEGIIKIEPTGGKDAPKENATGGIEHQVSIEAGDKNGQTLMTKIVGEGDAKKITTEWVDRANGPINITSSTEVSKIQNYSADVAEIVIEVTLQTTGDIDLTLPAVDGTEGQTISVKIVNTTDEHEGYLNIKVGGATLTYGAMPYQGWILKSTGGNWLVAARN